MRNSCFIIAELSANHNQNKQVAIDSIKAIGQTGVDAVKIQSYTPDSITLDCDNEYFRINQGTIWDGTTLYKLYESAFTPYEWYDELRNCAEAEGLKFFSSPFDQAAVDFLESKNAPLYKIASFEITDIPLIEYTASKGKPMIISTGIATIGEIQEAVEACRREKNHDITLLYCVSSYPAKPEEFNLKTMQNLKETFDVKIGLSDHSLNNDIAISSVALGAKVVEKHFILERTLGGPDAAFSLEPSQFKKLVSSIRTVEKALGHVNYSISEAKKRNRNFSRSLFAITDIKKGELFSDDNIRSIRPGNGIAPKYKNEIKGKCANDDISRGTPLSWDLIKNNE